LFTAIAVALLIFLSPFSDPEENTKREEKRMRRKEGGGGRRRIKRLTDQYNFCKTETRLCEVNCFLRNQTR
jgi:hypothetical protein